MAFRKFGISFRIQKLASNLAVLDKPKRLNDKQYIDKGAKDTKETNDFLYFTAKAILSDVPNGNGDIFTREEVLKAYSSFVGKHIDLNHSSDPKDRIGKIIDAYPTEEDDKLFIEIVGKIDKKLHPEIARNIETGVYDSVSMEAIVEESKCSICNHTIRNAEDKKCEHLENYVMKECDYNGKKAVCYAINSGITFTGLGVVDVPAEPAAKIKQIIASLKENNKLTLDEKVNNFVKVLAEELKDDFKKEFEKVDFEKLDKKDILEMALKLYKKEEEDKLKDLFEQYPQYKESIEMAIDFYEQLLKIKPQETEKENIEENNIENKENIEENKTLSSSNTSKINKKSAYGWSFSEGFYEDLRKALYDFVNKTIDKKELDDIWLAIFKEKAPRTSNNELFSIDNLVDILFEQAEKINTASNLETPLETPIEVWLDEKGEVVVLVENKSPFLEMKSSKIKISYKNQLNKLDNSKKYLNNLNKNYGENNENLMKGLTKLNALEYIELIKNIEENLSEKTKEKVNKINDNGGKVMGGEYSKKTNSINKKANEYAVNIYNEKEYDQELVKIAEKELEEYGLKDLLSLYPEEIIKYLFDGIVDAINRHGENLIEFNIKLGRIDIPDEVEDEHEAKEIFFDFQRDYINEFGNELKNKYSDFIEEWYIEGRSGGWFAVTPNSSIIHTVDDYLRDIYYYLEHSEKESKEKAEEEVKKMSKSLKEHIDKARKDAGEISKEVERAKKAFIKTIEDKEFWKEYYPEKFKKSSLTSKKNKEESNMNIKSIFVKKDGLENSKWIFTQDGKPLISATLKDIWADKLSEDKVNEYAVSSDFAEAVIDRIKLEGVDNVARLWGLEKTASGFRKSDIKTKYNIGLKNLKKKKLAEGIEVSEGSGEHSKGNNESVRKLKHNKSDIKTKYNIGLKNLKLKKLEEGNEVVAKDTEHEKGLDLERGKYISVERDRGISSKSVKNVYQSGTHLRAKLEKTSKNGKFNEENPFSFYDETPIQRGKMKKLTKKIKQAVAVGKPLDDILEMLEDKWWNGIGADDTTSREEVINYYEQHAKAKKVHKQVEKSSKQAERKIEREGEENVKIDKFPKDEEEVKKDEVKEVETPKTIEEIVECLDKDADKAMELKPELKNLVEDLKDLIDDMKGAIGEKVKKEEEESKEEVEEKKSSLNKESYFEGWDKEKINEAWENFGGEFEKCVEKTKEFADNPNAYCAALEKEATGKYPREAELDIEAKNKSKKGRSLDEWMEFLKGKVSPKIRREFKHIWEKSIKDKRGEEYAARAAIDILPKEVLEEPTKYHGKGKGKRGPISRKKSSLSKKADIELSETEKGLIIEKLTPIDMNSKKFIELYNDFIDDISGGDVDIAGMKYNPSWALEQIDSTAYRVGQADYLDSLLDSGEVIEVKGDMYWIEDAEKLLNKKFSCLSKEKQEKPQGDKNKTDKVDLISRTSSEEVSKTVEQKVKELYLADMDNFTLEKALEIGKTDEEKKDIKTYVDNFFHKAKVKTNRETQLENELKLVKERLQKEAFENQLKDKKDWCTKIVNCMLEKGLIEVSADSVNRYRKEGYDLIDAQHKAVKKEVNSQIKDLIAMDDISLRKFEQSINRIKKVANKDNKNKGIKKIINFGYESQDDNEEKWLSNLFNKMQ